LITTINRQSSLIKIQGPGGDRIESWQTKSLDAGTFDKLSDISQKIYQPELDNRKSNSRKIGSDAIKKSIIIPELKNIHQRNRKKFPPNIYPKENPKDIFSAKQTLITSVPTLYQGSRRKIVKNKIVNRPPFK